MSPRSAPLGERGPWDGAPGLPALLAVPLLVGAALLAVFLTGKLDPFTDDAYIFLRYGRNLVDGHGLVFNPGERVEGFTSPLWTLLAAAVLALRLPDEASLQVVGLLCLLGTLVSLALASREARLSPRVALWQLVALASTCAALYWARSGLETVAFAWAALEGTRRCARAADRREGGAVDGGAAFGVAALLRPEAVAWFGLAFGATWLFSLGDPSTRRARLRRALLSALAFLAPVVAWQAFRVAYYGQWLPNTFFAKADAAGYVLARGAGYLLASWATPWLALAVPVALRPRALRRPHAAIPALICAFHLAYVVAVGGDYFPLGRFLVPLLPLLLSSWGGAVDDLLASPAFAGPAARRRRAALFAALLAPVLSCALLPLVGPKDWRDGTNVNRRVLRYRATASWLAAHVGPEALVATSTVGAICYRGRVRCLDMLGLVDSVVAHTRRDLSRARPVAAHARTNAAYVLSRRPDVVLVGNGWVTREEVWRQEDPDAELFVSDAELVDQPEFLAAYSLVAHRLEGGEFLNMAVRRDSPYHPDHPAYRGPAPAHVGPFPRLSHPPL